MIPQKNKKIVHIYRDPIDNAVSNFNLLWNDKFRKEEKKTYSKDWADLVSSAEGKMPNTCLASRRVSARKIGRYLERFPAPTAFTDICIGTAMPFPYAGEWASQYYIYFTEITWPKYTKSTNSCLTS